MLGKALFTKITINGLLFAIVFSVCTLSSFGQLPKPSAPRNFDLPKPVEKTLPNGLRVIVAQTKNVPIVTAQLLILSGGEADPDKLSGLADFSMSLLTKGTKTRSATQIAQEIEFLGGSIGSGAGWDYSNVNVRVTADKIENALVILSDVVLHPAFSEEEIDRYREQLLDSLAVQMKQPGSLASNVSNKLIFGQYSEYAHPLAGTPDSVARIKQTDLQNFHRQYFSAKHAVLVFSGDISPQQAFTLADKYFSLMSAADAGFGRGSGMGGGNGNGNDDTTREKLREIVVVDLPDSGQAAVQYKKHFSGNKNYYIANVLNSILGGGYSSRLNQEVRIKRGLSYGAGSSFSMRLTDGLFRMSTQTKNESAAEVASLFIDELNKIGSMDISADELTPRKSVLTGNFGRAVATTNGLASTIGGLAVYKISLNEINSYISKTNSVTAADVKSFSDTNLTADKGIVVIVGDAKVFMDDLKKRFPTTYIRVIPADKLDLESGNLEK